MALSGSNAEIDPGGSSIGTAAINRAAEALRDGKLVVFPTETVYGLGADALNPDAIARVFAAKGRPADNPLIVHLSSVAEVPAVAIEPPDLALWLLERFAPGPFTVVLPRGPAVPPAVSAGLPTVAVRIPSHPVARALLAAATVPIAAPSANRSGRPSPTDVQSVRRELGDAVSYYLDGGPCAIGVESTVVRLDEGRCRVEVLREGATTREMIESAVTELATGSKWQVSGPGFTSAIGVAASPGVRHAHYAPTATVVPFETDADPPSFGGNAPRPGEDDEPSPGPFALVHLSAFGEPWRGNPPAYHRRFTDVEEYARELYRAFRQADDAGCRIIYTELPQDTGLGRALRDRIVRASRR